MIAEHLVCAFDSKSRRTGLLSHDSFPPGSAMIIAPTNAIHTFFMKFAIDVLFVSKDGRIVKISQSLSPWRVAGAWAAYGVIELAGGSLARCDTKPGDRVVVVPRDDASASH